MKIDFYDESLQFYKAYKNLLTIDLSSILK